MNAQSLGLTLQMYVSASASVTERDLRSNKVRL